MPLPTAFHSLVSNVLSNWKFGCRIALNCCAVGAEPPDLVPLDRTADVDRGVVVAIDLVAVLANRAVVECRRRRVLVRDVRALQRVVVPIEVVLAVELVAARLGDELRLHAGVRHFRRLAGRAEEHFLERRVVEVEAGAAGAFRGVDAFDQHADLAVLAVGAVVGLCAGAVAADVDARHLHGRRHRQQRPHVAAVGDRLQLLELEVLHDARRGGVDDRRLAGDGYGLLQGRQRELDVHVAVKPSEIWMPSRLTVLNPASS